MADTAQSTVTIDLCGIAPGPDSEDFFKNIVLRSKEPGLLIKGNQLDAVMNRVGAKGISVPDPHEPYQISLPLYIGATTPSATSEVPHWHPDQAEAYVVLAGEAELIAKNRWDDDGWVRRKVTSGDVVVAQPEVCHQLRWTSTEHGLALVFKAPQRAGIGRFPNGKVTCQFCPHFERGCVLPNGFTPAEVRKA